MVALGCLGPPSWRGFLEARVSECGCSGADWLFDLASAASPFDPGKLTRRAGRAWAAARMERITLHECRHTFASLMIAAGVNAKALQRFMGHAKAAIPPWRRSSPATARSG